ncbi:hypothetical protein [Streptosporangium lutulentum]|uniref:Uncharacterized protein n=1 Tax=Streptosporangium lutulentum TaxID=1461250 RepID=A0ABT9QP73_9ACTN|nr:hypothetical protein [Streptosporangium lutulentum]MDP9848567.1 hypothetical protein [Streptosporangium lutulentum]
MRFTLRRALAVGATLAVVGVMTPGAAYSQDDPRSCNDLMSADAPAFVMCHWLATPEEARDIAMFWGANDSANLKEATPQEGKFIDCSSPGDVCPVLEGPEISGDENSPIPDGAEEGGVPECEAGQQCSVDGYEAGGDGTVSRSELGNSTLPVGATSKNVTMGTQDTAAAAAAAAAQTPTGQAITAAKAGGFRVWLDTELADDWKAGTAAFTATVKRIGALAARPEVAGIRFTSQLGYNKSFKTAEEINAFVTAASAALRQVAPGKRLGVHTVVPEFACGANDACKTEMRKQYPLLVPEQLEASLTAGGIDQISLDTGLLYGGYTPWKIDAEQAQRNQWIQVRASSWDVLAQIAAEETGLVGEVTAEQVASRVSTPVMDGAAQQVNLWTRVQNAQGTVNRLTAWDELKKLTPIQRRMAAVYDPNAPETNVAADLKKLSEVFGQIYLTTA